MKILAFSDWRVQPLEMVKCIVAEHKPDAILYAGDDLNRLVELNDSLLIKTSNHLAELNYHSLKPLMNTQREIFTKSFRKKFRELITKMQFENKGILQKLGIPFYYVNGNDDITLNLNNNIRYTYFHSRHLDTGNNQYAIAETSDGKITLKNRNSNQFAKIDTIEGRITVEKKVYDPLNPDTNNGFDVPKEIFSKDGIYVPINPNFGDFKVHIKNEEIAVFGYECKFGLKSDVKNNPEDYADIYLSHIPPMGTLDLSVRFGMDHIGSKKLLYAIKKYHPKLVICGHSHLWGGMSKKIGDTLVINVSSQDQNSSYGNYALIETNDWSVEMKVVEDKTRYPVRGLNTIKDTLRKKRVMLACVGDAIYNKEIIELERNLNQWARNSLKSSEQCSKTLERVEKLGIGTQQVKERIESLKWKNPKVIGKISINPTKFAFVDVETGLANGQKPGKLWLIGLWYNEDFKQFEYPNGEDEFLNYLKQNRIKSLVSWTGYDRKVLQPLLRKVNIKVDFIDACQRTSNCVIWHTYQLHKLYDALFQDERKENLIPGHISGLYADHLIIPNKSCSYCPPKEEIIDQIKKRNRIDICQMIEICIKLRNE